MSFMNMLKRDIVMRFNESKVTYFVISLAIALLLLCFLWNSNKTGQLGHQSFSDSLTTLFHSMNFFDLHILYTQHRLSIPLQWISFQVLPLMIVGNFMFRDIQISGAYILPKLPKKEIFIFSKLLSLFVLIVSIWCVWLFIYIMLFISFKGFTAELNSKVILFMLIQILVSFMYAVLLETLTFMISFISAFIIIVAYIVISIFFHSALFIASFAMAGKWAFIDYSRMNVNYSNGRFFHACDFLIIALIFCAVCTFISLFFIKKTDILGE